jgi:hypothetical protein
MPVLPTDWATRGLTTDRQFGMPRRNVLALLLAALAFAIHSAVLAPLVGMVGWSRAVSVGLHTLVADHAGALGAAAVATFLAALVAALVAARRLRPVRVTRVLVALAGLEVLAALGPVAAVGELTLVHVPHVAAAISGLGLVLVSTGAALVVARRLDRS